MLDMQIIVAAFAGSVGGVWSLAWWLSAKFGKVYHVIAEHEKEDEKRFGAIQLQITEGRLNATIQAQAAVIAKHDDE